MGFLWGAYHFFSGHDVSDQVDIFLDVGQWGDDAARDAGTLLALDWEPSSGSGSDMSLDQAHDFVTQIRARTGRFSVVYGGLAVTGECERNETRPVIEKLPVMVCALRFDSKGNSCAPHGRRIHSGSIPMEKVATSHTLCPAWGVRTVIVSKAAPTN
jgi:hypothetical protein